jgi:hypothetical protein
MEAAAFHQENIRFVNHFHNSQNWSDGCKYTFKNLHILKKASKLV